MENTLYNIIIEREVDFSDKVWIMIDKEIQDTLRDYSYKRNFEYNCNTDVSTLSYVLGPFVQVGVDNVMNLIHSKSWSDVVDIRTDVSNCKQTDLYSN